MYMKKDKENLECIFYDLQRYSCINLFANILSMSFISFVGEIKFCILS